jgi:hypothetical protein
MNWLRRIMAWFAVRNSEPQTGPKFSEVCLKHWRDQGMDV